MPGGSRASPEHRLRMTIRIVVVVERVCCSLVLDSVTLTPQWIRQPKPHDIACCIQRSMQQLPDSGSWAVGNRDFSLSFSSNLRDKVTGGFRKAKKFLQFRKAKNFFRQNRLAAVLKQYRRTDIKILRECVLRGCLDKPKRSKAELGRLPGRRGAWLRMRFGRE